MILWKSRVTDNRIHLPNKNPFRDNKILTAVLFIHTQKDNLAGSCMPTMRTHEKSHSILKYIRAVHTSRHG
jgi:hypothetical protein